MNTLNYSLEIVSKVQGFDQFITSLMFFQKKNRKTGRNKYWKKEIIIRFFSEVVLFINSKPKQAFIRKYFHFFYRAVENSNEITWHELYAIFGFDYVELCNDPFKWTFIRFVKELKTFRDNGDDISPYALFKGSKEHRRFYRAFRYKIQKGLFTEEDVYSAIGENYKEIVKLQKMYPNKESVRKGLIREYKNNPFVTLSTDILKKSNMTLYLATMRYGSSFAEACKNVGFIITKKEKTIPEYKVSIDEKRNLCIIYGHRFEPILEDIFNQLNLPYVKNEKTIYSSVPDFVHKVDEKFWIEAKLTSKLVNQHIRNGKYHTKAEKVSYVYCVPTEDPITDIPGNVEIYHVSFYLNQMKNNRKKWEILGRINEIIDMVSNLGIDYTR